MSNQFYNPTGNPITNSRGASALIATEFANIGAGFTALEAALLSASSEAQGTTTNNYVVTLTPAPASYATPMTVTFQATHTNTGNCTLQIGSLAQCAMLDIDGNQFQAGQIQNNAFVAAYYNGTNFYVVSANGIQTGVTQPAGVSSTNLATMANVQSITNLQMLGSPTVPVVTASTPGQQPCSVAYAQGLAFASISSPTKQVQTLSTDGNVLENPGVTYTSVYINATANYQQQLPNATSLPIGFCYEVYSVNAWYAVNSDGSGFGSIAAGLTRFFLKTAGTQNGSWGYTTPAAFASVSKSFNAGAVATVATGIANVSNLASVQLDQTRTLVFWTQSNSVSTDGLWCVVVTVTNTSSTAGRPTISVGAPVAIDTLSGLTINCLPANLYACSIGTDSTVVAWNEVNGSSTTPKVAVVTTSVATATVGSLQTLHASSSSTTSHCFPAVCALGGGSFFVMYYDGTGTTMYARACTTSGNTITLGAETSVFASAVDANYTLSQLTTGAVVFSRAVSAARGYLTAATVSGTTITLGTAVEVTGTLVTYFSSYPLNQTSSIAVTSSTSGLYAYTSSSYILGTAFTVSGTTLTFGTETQLVASEGSSGVYALPVSSTRAVVFNAATNVVYDLAISGTTITVNGNAGNGGPYCAPIINGLTIVVPGQSTSQALSLATTTPTADATVTVALGITANNAGSMTMVIGNTAKTLLLIGSSGTVISAAAALANFALS